MECAAGVLRVTDACVRGGNVRSAFDRDAVHVATALLVLLVVAQLRRRCARLG